MLICLFLMILEYQFKIPKQKITFADVNFNYEHKEEATRVLNRGAQTASRGSCLSQVLNRVPRPLPAAPFLLCRRYLAVVLRSLAVALRPMLKPLPAATRRCRIRRITLGN